MQSLGQQIKTAADEDAQFDMMASLVRQVALNKERLVQLDDVIQKLMNRVYDLEHS